MATAYLLALARAHLGRPATPDTKLATEVARMGRSFWNGFESIHAGVPKHSTQAAG